MAPHFSLVIGMHVCHRAALWDSVLESLVFTTFSKLKRKLQKLGSMYTQQPKWIQKVYLSVCRHTYVCMRICMYVTIIKKKDYQHHRGGIGRGWREDGEVV